MLCSCYLIGFMAFAHVQERGNQPDGLLSVRKPELITGKHLSLTGLRA